MPYPAVDPEKIGPGMPLDVSNLETLWKGNNRTNGFLMRSVDGRIPALQLPIGRLVIDAYHPLAESGLIPWGNALWRDNGSIDTRPGTVNAEKPAKGEFVGVLKFNQGWQAGNPVQPWGLPAYSKGVIVNKGLVGYKTALADIYQKDEYLLYLKGAADQDKDTVRTTYTQWVAALKAAAAGSRLGLFFDDASGYPFVSVVLAADIPAPALTGMTFAGFAAVYEREHEAVFFDITG
jgi:hypothetical protein